MQTPKLRPSGATALGGVYLYQIKINYYLETSFPAYSLREIIGRGSLGLTAQSMFVSSSLFALRSQLHTARTFSGNFCTFTRIPRHRFLPLDRYAATKTQTTYRTATRGCATMAKPDDFIR